MLFIDIYFVFVIVSFIDNTLHTTPLHSLGIIPMIELGAFGHLNIGKASITFASGSTDGDGYGDGDSDGDSDGDGGEGSADLRAYVGVASDVLAMLDSVLESPTALFMQSNGLYQAMQEYIDFHPLTIGIDSNCELFDFSNVMSMSAELVSAVVSRTQSPRINKTYFDMSSFDHLPKFSSGYIAVS